jgi:hypothetical protein
MNDPIERQEVITSIMNGARAAGRLAENDTVFRAAVDAFRAADAESFQKLLARLKIVDCELVCFWLRSKECVLECVELCGPPEEPLDISELPRLAEIIAKITGDEELVERLAEAVRDRDGNDFRSLVKELKIERFCHLLCHWVCTVHWRLVCEVVCSPRRVPIRHLVDELTAAGAAIGRLSQDKKKLDQIIKSTVALDCEILSGLIGQEGECVFICEWICSWHCVLVCLPLCRPFGPFKETSIDEMRAFARISGELAAKPGVLNRFVEAELTHNAEAFSSLIRENKLERFALQLCHWICYTVCRRFCLCVCPPVTTIPLFTHVGNYHVDPIYNNFTAAGTTFDHGWAFTQTVDLKGILPDGQAPDALEYRFTYQNLGGGEANPITGAMIPATVIGQLEYRWYNTAIPGWVPGSHDYFVNNPGAVANIPQQFGLALVVPVNVDTDANGWIAVPRENNLVNGGVGRFAPTGILARLDTTKLTSEVFDLTAAAPPLPLKAGDPVPAAQKSVKPIFQINFEARKVIVHTGVSSNTLNKIALSNTNYTYNRHPDWAGSPPLPPTSSPIVLSLDISELLMGGCNPLGDTIHALFSAYHPYLATCQLYLEGPAPLPPAVNPPISAAGEADSPGGGQTIDTSALKPCAYILWLSATLNLTDGYTQAYGTFTDHIAFCKD